MSQSSITTADDDLLQPLLQEPPPPEETLLESVTFPVRYGTQNPSKSKSKDCYDIIKFLMSGNDKYLHLIDQCLVIKHLCEFPDFIHSSSKQHNHHFPFFRASCLLFCMISKSHIC
jgi:hypothetical protein